MAGEQPLSHYWEKEELRNKKLAEAEQSGQTSWRKNNNLSLEGQAQERPLGLFICGNGINPVALPSVELNMAKLGGFVFLSRDSEREWEGRLPHVVMSHALGMNVQPGLRTAALVGSTPCSAEMVT